MKGPRQWAWAVLLAAAPPPESIRTTAKHILAQGDFDLNPNHRPTSVIWDALQWILNWIDKHLHWLNLSFAGLSWFTLWTLVGLAGVLLFGLITHSFYTFYWVPRHKAKGLVAEGEVVEGVDALLARAEQLAAAGNYVDASRTLYRAALERLEEERGGRVRTGLTNTEYVRTFHTPWVTENLKIFADLINWKWYRDRTFDADDYGRCHQAYRRIEDGLQERA